MSKPMLKPADHDASANLVAGEPGWRVVGWYASCIALMVGALFAILHGAQGFGSPAATSPEPESDPEDFRRVLAADVALWAPIVKSLGLKLD